MRFELALVRRRDQLDTPGIGKGCARTSLEDSATDLEALYLSMLVGKPDARQSWGCRKMREICGNTGELGIFVQLLILESCNKPIVYCSQIRHLV